MSDKPDTPNGDGYAYNFDRRLDRINDTISAVVDALVQDRELFNDTMREMRLRHIETMEEIRELILLQREHRIDMVALFEISKRSSAPPGETGL